MIRKFVSLLLRSKSKVLFSMRKINRLMVSNRTVIVTISENRVPTSIIHADGFTKYFPNIYLFFSAQFN